MKMYFIEVLENPNIVETSGMNGKGFNNENYI